MLQPKYRLSLLVPAVLAAWTFVASAQTAPPAPGTNNTGRLDELGCRNDRVTASYRCERPPLAGKNFTNKQDALKALQQQRTAPKPALKPSAAAPAKKSTKTARIDAPAPAPKVEPDAATRAASWTRVANGEGAQYFIDTAHLDTQGRTVTAHTLTRYESPRSSSTMVQPYRSTVSIERYDCAARTSALTEMRYHAEGNGAGKALQTVAIPENKLAYLAPTPGTVNEQLLNQVCSPKR